MSCCLCAPNSNFNFFASVDCFFFFFLIIHLMRTQTPQSNTGILATSKTRHMTFSQLRTLFGLRSRQLAPTEARVSIRESLKIFRCIEEYLGGQYDAENEPLAFERLVAKNSNQTIRFNSSSKRSCGLTSHCFASLFFSRNQMASNNHLAYTNGSDIVQVWENWNLVLYGIWRQNQIGYKVENLATRILRSRAISQAETLSETLLKMNVPEELPRVIFCNMTWVLLHDRKRNHDTRELDNKLCDELQDVKDHQWAIIKHTNGCFQVVQGYVDDCKSIGCCLTSWQNQLRHDTHKGGQFASRNGFSDTTMAMFLFKIREFASASKFDAASHMSLFGMFHHESDNVAVWPSVSFREITDESIDGYGCRFVANSIHHLLSSPK